MAVRGAILRYLEGHPSASDSVKGICAFWIPAEGVDGPEAVVEEALEELTAEGLVRRIELVDRTIVYAAGKAPGRRVEG